MTALWVAVLVCVDEFVDSGGAELASRMGAFSADHLMVCEFFADRQSGGNMPLPCF